MLDAIVIGAGAAGLAAARRLHDRGARVVTLEARDRIGGRAWSSYVFGPFAVELGAEFVHGENVVTWQLIETLGIETRLHDGFSTLVYNGGELEDGGQHPLFYLMRSKITALAREWEASGQPDVSVAEAIRRHPERFPELFDDESWQIWENAAAALMCANLDELGLLGRLESSYEGDGDLNFRLVDGYSELWRRYAEGLDIRLTTPVTAVRWSAEGVSVTAGGAEYAARRAIVTLPLGVLQSGVVVFDPPLPERKWDAIQGLHPGAIVKTVFAFDEPFWPAEMGFLFTPLASQTWWTPLNPIDTSAPVLTGYVSARNARHFLAGGPDSPLELLRDLETMFGQPLAHRLTRPPLVVPWGSDPWTRGGYASRPPGARGLLARMAEPVDDVLFFAGEATHVTRPVAVHGALETGWRAADEATAAGS